MENYACSKLTTLPPAEILKKGRNILNNISEKIQELEDQGELVPEIILLEPEIYLMMAEYQATCAVLAINSSSGLSGKNSANILERYLKEGFSVYIGKKEYKCEADFYVFLSPPMNFSFCFN